ncbi:MAG TPA: hypothetical protein PLF91_12865, partial [Mycolicibacterium fallax]|nr:hypothetical protein [Mycolicibacterium fallax]
NRLYEVSLRVQQICERYDLPYTTGPFLVQYAKTWRTIAKLSVPDKFLRDTADDAPETRSELMFAGLVVEAEGPSPYGRRGLKSAITAARVARQERRRARKRAAKTPTPVPDAGAPRSGQDGPVAA